MKKVFKYCFTMAAAAQAKSFADYGTTEVIHINENEVNGDKLKMVFASCYDAARRPNRTIFEDIRSEDADAFIWLGDYAYISRSERLNYLRLLEHPGELLSNLPTIMNSFLLSVKYTISKLTGHEQSKNYFEHSWSEWLAGGFDIYPGHMIEEGMM